jgi:hypothetical protein
MSGFLGVMKLDAMTQVYAVLNHWLFLWMTEPDVLMVLFDPGLSGTSCLSSIDLPTFAGDAG